MIGLLHDLIYTVPAALLAITCHEFAHGYVSYKLGDPTPMAGGRLSFNPLHHLDPVGTLCLVLFHFGWAKPVMVNPRYYRNPKTDMVKVALAGPAMNFLLAFVSTLLMGLILKVTGGYADGLVRYAFYLLQYIALINLGLGTFNLIPIPPLDGSKVLSAVLPTRIYFSIMRYERYGQLLLVGLLVLGFLDWPLGLAQGMISHLFWWITDLLFGL